MQTIRVELGERSHPINVGRGIVANLGDYLQTWGVKGPVAVVTDRNVARLHLRKLHDQLAAYRVTDIIIPPGERQKTLARAGEVFAKLLSSGFSRTSTLIAFGGGVVGDLAGFVAATFRRGIPFVQVPTTLLACVESALGGKTAVNHERGKNAIGAYHQPLGILSDTEILETLPEREITCGLGEIVKYALLEKNFWTFLENNLDAVRSRDPGVLEELIVRCNRYKAKLIQEDERELTRDGGRGVLNLGHTIGHALEELSGYKLHHGEAVLVGLQWEMLIARELGVLGAESFLRLQTLLDRIGFKPDVGYVGTSKIIRSLYRHGRMPRFVLPADGGLISFRSDIPEDRVEKTIQGIKKPRTERPGVSRFGR